jgi:hypothetical protein
MAFAIPLCYNADWDMATFALQESIMSEKNRRLSFWPGALVVVSVLLAMPLRSQTIDGRVQELEKKVAQLEQQIKKLEGIVLQLQKTPAKPVATSPEKWKDKASWRSLKKGMSKSEVEQILGTPPKIVPNNYYGDIWYYPDSKGGFASFDKESLLATWNEI